MRILTRLARWSAAVLSLYAAYRFLRAGALAGSSPAGIASLLAMFGCLILIPVLLLPDLLPIVTRPFTAIIDEIYGTAPGRNGRPPLSYDLARSYLRQSRIADALGEYGRIMKFYPREVEPYRESIVLLLTEFEDRDEAESMLRRGLKKLRSTEDRAELEVTFADVSSAAFESRI